MKLCVRILARLRSGAQRPRLKTESSAADYSAADGFTRGRMDFFTEAARTLDARVYCTTTRKPTLLARVEGKKRKRVAERQPAAGENHDPPLTIRDWSKTSSSSLSSYTV